MAGVFHKQIADLMFEQGRKPGTQGRETERDKERNTCLVAVHVHDRKSQRNAQKDEKRCEHH